MARDRYTTTVICPKCGRRGKAEWSAADNPIFQGFNRSLESLSDGFQRGRMAVDDFEYDEILCATCKVVVNTR